ncbi:hypothetical protein H8S95_01440 [Pontibacter sp. KCTC 32443]|uniref:hypothetical protein n=1 Tax=Pontibacter TaxID=323449 RepID=UPI00164D9886|nr:MULTISPECIES: hypothetical protein [Pontibacter]MBC5772712.1 hypothetical protein [Pontibacter sp. KCTC 32443]
MEKEFINEFGKIYSKVIYLPKHYAVVVEWYGYTTRAQVELVGNFIQEWGKGHTFTVFVNDCTNIISVWEDSIEWFSRIWVQRMKGRGLKKFIHIAKSGSFGEQIGEQLYQILKEQMQFYSYKNRADAMYFVESSKTSLNN